MTQLPKNSEDVKCSDKVVLPGCSPVGEVLRISKEKGALVQWPPSNGEYVRPCWYELIQLELI